MALTSVIRYVSFLDSTLTTGAGKTGLAFGDVTAKYLVDGGTLTSLTTETITTLGTYQAPTSSAHLRIKELSSSDPAKGVYEVHFHDTQLATGTKLWLLLSATGAVPVRFELDLTNISGRLPAALTADGNIKADTLRVSGTTQTAKDIGAAVPAATAGAAGGLFIAGSNAATTIAGLTTGALSCSTITASGAVAFQSTFAVTTSTALGALSATTVTFSGAVAFQSTFAVTTSTALGALSASTVTFSGAVAFQSTFAVTTSTSLADLSCATLTASGAVAFQSTFATTGTTTFNALTVTNATTLSGAVTFGSTWGVTGAVTFTAGLTANITGNLIGTVSTLTTYTGNTPQTGDVYALAAGASGFAATKVDTAAIKVQTDKFVFTVTNEVNANARYFGGQAVTAAAGVTVGAFVGNATAAISVDSSGRVKIQSGVTKNAALANFDFPMYDDTDHITPLTGLTVVAERSIDGAAFGACANSAVEIGTTGIYVIDLDATDLNGTTILFRFSATGADDTMVEFVTTL